MVKKRGLLITGIFLFILAGINFFMFLNKDGISYGFISGMYIKEIPQLPFGLNLSNIAFIIQWIILLSILVFAYSRFVKHKKEEELKLDFHLVKKNYSRSETDLDSLFDLLKDKRNLSTKSISKLFNISKEKALEWAKILENHELVKIEYPAFADPEVKINEKENKEKNQNGKQKQKNLPEKEEKTKQDEKEQNGKTNQKTLPGKEGINRKPKQK